MNLKEYGLNSYESQAYTSLLELGLSTAHIISKQSKVPHGKIYPVLASLEEKKFIKVYEGIPKKFMAIDPKIVLNESLRKKALELNDLKNRSSKIISILSSLSSKEEHPLESIHIIEGYKNYLNLSVTLHNNAKEEWLTISRLPVYKPHLDAYKKCVKNGVNVKILASKTNLSKDQINAWKKTKANIKATDVLQTRFSVIDKKEVIIRFSDKNKYLALWIKNPSLAQSMRNYFLGLWGSANKI